MTPTYIRKALRSLDYRSTTFPTRMRKYIETADFAPRSLFIEASYPDESDPVAVTLRLVYEPFDGDPGIIGTINDVFIDAYKEMYTDICDLADLGILIKGCGALTIPERVKRAVCASCSFYEDCHCNHNTDPGTCEPYTARLTASYEAETRRGASASAFTSASTSDKEN